MTSFSSLLKDDKRRAVCAIVVTIAAAVASAGSLDVSSPQIPMSAESLPETTALTPAHRSATRTIHVHVEEAAITSGIEIEILGVVREKDPGDGPEPVVSAVIEPDEGDQLDATVPSPDAGAEATITGNGTLALAAGRACTGKNPPCDEDFELTLTQKEPADADLEVIWNATATVVFEDDMPTMTVDVTNP